MEVVILSRNDPETGMRVMRSVARHGLDITRAIFMQGHAPYLYMGPLKMSLFLSANEADVREATELGFAAGHVVGRSVPDDGDSDLRIASTSTASWPTIRPNACTRARGWTGIRKARAPWPRSLSPVVRWPISWRKSTGFSGSRSRTVQVIRRGIGVGCMSPSYRPERPRS